MINTFTLAKILTSLALLHPVLSLGVNLATYSSGTCGDDTLIASGGWDNNGCVPITEVVGKSYTVDTTDGAFTCAENQYAVLKVWQSSNNCGNIPDASIGALSTTPLEGSCILGPIRSARLQCQNNDGT